MCLLCGPQHVHLESKQFLFQIHYGNIAMVKTLGQTRLQCFLSHTLTLFLSPKHTYTHKGGRSVGQISPTGTQKKSKK